VSSDADGDKMSGLTFDDFQMDIRARTLLHKGSKVNIGSRAFDILATLAARAGEIVEKRQLIQAVWPNTHVDEGALRVHLVALRRAIEERSGRQLIQNIPGKGYALTTLVSDEASAVTQGNNLPAILDPLVGRQELIERIISENDRLRTLVGPGGIGKTAIALAVGAEARRKRNLVTFVDLTAVKTADMVLKVIGQALGIDVSMTTDVSSLISAIGDSNMLLILDGCERVIDETAIISEMLLRGSLNLRILVTSREQMRALGERVTYIEGLALPKTSSADVHAAPAAMLFVERAMAAGAAFDLDSPELKDKIAQIVRAFEGVPLAIELAAGRVPDMGIDGILQELSAPLEILKFGRRTAPDRHKSMRACLEWSLSTLSSAEISMLKKLVERVPKGDFITLRLSDPVLRVTERDALDGLIAKSLVSPAFAGNHVFLARSIAEIFQEGSSTINDLTMEAVFMGLMRPQQVPSSRASSVH